MSGMRSSATPPVRGEIVIRVAPMAFGGWESDVVIEGDGVGGGTAPTASGALDVAMDILYGDKNDWINGDEGHLARLEAQLAERSA